MFLFCHIKLEILRLCDLKHIMTFFANQKAIPPIKIYMEIFQFISLVASRGQVQGVGGCKWRLMLIVGTKASSRLPVEAGTSDDRLAAERREDQ